ncbi:MAG: von Willebrand factor type A domain-containing protein [Clostridia bacterium]|nr:von Willebrand factor type A domain-containing protein [Clostridia bacterium]
MKKRSVALVALISSMAVLLCGCALPTLLMTLVSTMDSARHTGQENVPGMVNEYTENEPTEGYVVDEDISFSAAEATGAFPEIFDFNTEEYAAVSENGFKNVNTDPLSTFSADVDTASYCNLRRMLNAGYDPADIPSGAIRIEEMLNYFRYDYRKPEDGKKFGVTAQLSACPWNANHQLLMLGVRASESPVNPTEGSNLVFLVDVSGSMADENKLPLVQQALILLVNQLGENDTVSIVTYASGEDVLIEGAHPKKDQAALLSAINSLYASGSTDGQRGLAQAYETAMKYRHPKGNNRVIMCSDGDLNVGMTSESDLHDYVSNMKETGIYLSVLGFGEGNYKDTKMETLADDGNGNYYYIDSILEANKVLCEELTQSLFTVADDVKFQVEFNPAKVSAWRQIGYENRSLGNEAFADDSKDAGEVGEGTSVTVLYEIKPAENANTAPELRYQTSALTQEAKGDEWLTLSTRFKEPGEDESRLQTDIIGQESYAEKPSTDYLFAAAVAEFGMLLSDSDYKGDSSFESVLELLKESSLSDPYREEFFSLVKIAQRNSALSH